MGSLKTNGSWTVDDESDLHVCECEGFFTLGKERGFQGQVWQVAEDEEKGYHGIDTFD